MTARSSIPVPLLLACALLLSACNRSMVEPPTATVAALPTATDGPTVTPELNPPPGAVVSPDGNYYALVRSGGVLVVGARGGGEAELASSQQITEFQWLPDSRRLVFADRAPVDDDNPELVDRLWLADRETIEVHAITVGFAPLLSPDGRHLAFLRGTQSGDACLVDFELGIVVFNDEFVPTQLVRQRQIAGMPVSQALHSFQPDLGDDLLFPGRWRDAGTLEVSMRWACEDQLGQSGAYAIEVDSLQAELIEQ